MPMVELLLRTRGSSPGAALTLNQKLLEYRGLQEDRDQSPGAIFLAKAGRMMKNLGAMFVSLPGGQEGYLPLPEGVRPQPGDRMLVQMKRPAQGGKQAHMTSEISLTGRYAVLLPLGGQAYGASRARDKKTLAALARRLKPEGMGLVLRSNAQDVRQEDIQAELEQMLARWNDIRQAVQACGAPALIAPGPAPLERLLRDAREIPRRVLADDGQAAQSLGLPFETSPDPFALYQIDKQLHQALQRRVFLPSGGSLVLDPCEACLVIDVNSARDTTKGHDVRLKTNLEAAELIPRLLRIRQAGGIILIDFIDMQQDAHREQVQQRLQEGLRQDSAASQVLGFTRLGMLEMTRRRTEAPLSAQTNRCQAGLVEEQEDDGLAADDE